MNEARDSIFNREFPHAFHIDCGRHSWLTAARTGSLQRNAIQPQPNGNGSKVKLNAIGCDSPVPDCALAVLIFSGASGEYGIVLIKNQIERLGLASFGRTVERWRPV